MDIAPALAAGNGVVQKADNQGALTILAARRAFIDAGVPGRAVGGRHRRRAGDRQRRHRQRRLRLLHRLDRDRPHRSAQRAAGRLIGASLELGGKNPLIVLDDADPKKAAADAAYACFSAAGQLCVSMERIYVTKGVADAFTTAFAERVAGLKLGSAFDYSTDVGSLTTAAQLERVTAHLDDAVAKGATVLAGGKPRPDLGPYFFEPTVLTNVTSEMACFGDETFGALVAVTVVEDADAAVAAANDSEYGLNASVLSGSRSRGRTVARRREGRQRQRQRGLPRDVRQRRRPDGRRQALRPRTPQRPRGPAPLRRVAHDRRGDRPAAAAAHGPRVRRS